MKYYPLSRNWARKIQPHLGDPELNEVLVRDFNKFTFGRWEMPFKEGMMPPEFKSCDWDAGHRGQPRKASDDCASTAGRPVLPCQIARVLPDRYPSLRVAR